jgi:hypothetical protein
MNRENNVIHLNWIDDTERWIVIPGTIKEGRKRRIKELFLRKNNCFFARGVPKSIIDFTYRSVKKLGLTEKNIFFIKGTVRIKKGVVKNAVMVKELDWDVGTLITIPAGMRYREKLILEIEGEKKDLRLMELAILHGLLQIAFPKKSSAFYSHMSALVIVRGWDQLREKEFPDIRRLS